MWEELGVPGDFWRQTPRSYDVRIRGRLKALERERDAVTTGAWLAEAYSRMGRSFPRTLGKALGRKAERQVLTKPQDILDFMDNLGAAIEQREGRKSGPRATAPVVRSRSKTPKPQTRKDS